MPDKIKFEILEDGTLSVETDAISGQNHMSADEFLKTVEKLVGGTSTTKHKDGHSTHRHGNTVHTH
jgi:hypothetical protein